MIGLAVSGGVDSMALTYLAWRARRQFLGMRLADNPVGSYHCLTVDHRLREGSDLEARAVARVLYECFGLRAIQLSIHWHVVLMAAGVSHPKDLPNFETLARRLRYRRMASMCVQANVGSLLLGHHQDDQYETVLMRLVSGHGRAGLMGMRAATDIPECHDIHGAYQSGFIDDQMSQSPMINYRPTKYERRTLRAEMRAEMRAETTADVDLSVAAQEVQEGPRADAFSDVEFDAYVPRTKWVLRAAPLGVEDGGITVYRPLLEFPKDRLVATCEANGVPWFEDATNHDRTVTMRNAVRHLYVNHTLPVALQKPAVLDMSNRLRRQAALDEGQVDRLLKRTVVKGFDSTAGTVVVQVPSFRVPRLRKGQNNTARRQKRLEHYRHIATLLFKRLIAIVTPEPLGSSSSNLQNWVPRLFPSLNDRPSEYPKHPKPFTISGVYFSPVRPSSKPDAPLQWYLSRQPYVSGHSLPRQDYARLRLRHRWRRRPEKWRWPPRGEWKLWDGRFWVTVSNRSPVPVAFAPFDIKHAKTFRDSLADDGTRDELMALLKMHAPGKVRYTLPALYTAGDYAHVVDTYQDFAERKKAEMLSETEAERQWMELTKLCQRRVYLTALQWQRERGNNTEENWVPEYWARDDKRVLVALPTLGIARPGLQNWIRYDIRYKRVDRKMLGKTVRDEKELAWLERAKAEARVRGRRRWIARCAPRRRRPAGMRSKTKAGSPRK